MAAVANNPKFAKKVGIPQSVGEDYIKADKGRKFSRGGEMATNPMNTLRKNQRSAIKTEKTQNRAERKGMRTSMQREGADKKDIRQAVKGLRTEQRAEIKGMRTANEDARSKAAEYMKQRRSQGATAAGGKKMGIGKFMQDQMGGNKKAAEMYSKYTPQKPKPGEKVGGGLGSYSQKDLAKANKSPAPNLKQVAGAGLAAMGGMKKGGKVKCMAGGGYVRAADGCTKKGKTKGKII